MRDRGLALYNPATGRGDMRGKSYLLDLFAAGLPVIPTVDRLADVNRLPGVPEYVVKPVAGADSIGLRFVPAAGLGDVDDSGVLLQPRIDFRYEVSFVFVDRDFQYAVHAPDPHARWRLEPYPATAADLDFAQQFIDWNTLERGIQRVDACRTTDGDLLLVELEDLNPYLSLDLLTATELDRFVSRVVTSLRSGLAAR